jgi:hypothetical protein
MIACTRGKPAFQRLKIHLSNRIVNLTSMKRITFLMTSIAFLYSTNAAAFSLALPILSDTAPVEQCCDKWNGGAMYIGNRYFAVIQKGLKKKTRVRVGDTQDGYDTEEEAQEVADDAADERNGK